MEIKETISLTVVLTTLSTLLNENLASANVDWSAPAYVRRNTSSANNVNPMTSKLLKDLNSEEYEQQFSEVVDFVDDILREQRNSRHNISLIERNTPNKTSTERFSRKFFQGYSLYGLLGPKVSNTSAGARLDSRDLSASSNSVTAKKESDVIKRNSQNSRYSGPGVGKRLYTSVPACSFDTKPLNVHFTEEILWNDRTAVLVCEGQITVNKCEGQCVSSVSPGGDFGFDRVSYRCALKKLLMLNDTC